VWNLVDGIDVYKLTDNPTCHLLLVRTLRVKIRRNRICDVQFDSTGEFAISGSDNGEVHLWDIDSGQLDQALCHGKGKNQLNKPSMTVGLIFTSQNFLRCRRLQSVLYVFFPHDRDAFFTVLFGSKRKAFYCKCVLGT
jgi:WD40 repeat protein